MKGQGGRLSPDKMLKQAQRTKGYLLKKSSSIIASWQRRYFIIANSSLAYYPDQTLEKQKGTISLMDIHAIVMKGSNQFILETPKRNYEFQCEKEEDRDLWVASLNIIKEFLSDNGLTKKFIVKSQKKQEVNLKNKQQSLNETKKMLSLLKLEKLSEEIEEPRIHNRICIFKDSTFSYFSISIKSLEAPEEDEELLSEKYILPYQFNKFYKISATGQVEDLGKVSQMVSFKTDDQYLAITLSDKSKIRVVYDDEGHAHEISRKLCRNFQVAKEYYNPLKILLKKNCDRLIFFYDHHRQVFEEQVKYRTGEALKKYQNESDKPVQVFIESLRSVKKGLQETDEALRVMNPSRDQIKAAYFKIAYEIICEQISKAWESLHTQFQFSDYLKMAYELYECWIVTNMTVRDSKLLQGCTDLNKFYLRRQGQKIKTHIEKINFSKVEVRKNKSEPISNEISFVFLDWLKDFTSSLSDTAPVQSVFDEYCKFLNKSLEEFTEYLIGISDKWTDSSVLLGACNDISRIKNYFIRMVGPELCNGLVAETKFQNTCSNNIISKLNDAMSHLIKRIFLVIFGSIEKKILTRPFLDLDIAKICYEVLQRLEPFKKKALEDVDDQIIMLSFDEICFFFYTRMMRSKISQAKNVKEQWVSAIRKALTELKQYYSNIKTETRVKQHLREYQLLEEILTCPETLLMKTVIQLRQIFGISFNEDSIDVVLKVRQVSEQNFPRLFTQCCQGIRQTSSSEDSTSRDEFDVHNRSRKSTLTESIIDLNSMEMVSYTKQGREGYLSQKKFCKGVPVSLCNSFFRIKQGKLLEFNSSNSYEILSSINLNKVDNIYLENNGDSTFVIITGNEKYCFITSSRDEAGRWIQAIYSEIGQPVYENKTLAQVSKDKRDCLFKNFEAELTTTATVKLKTVEFEEDEKVLQIKRLRRLKEIQRDSKGDKIKTSSPRRKDKIYRPAHQSPVKAKKVKREDQGTCCSRTFF